ncbi:aldehyde dehydrogenase family protein [Pseudenhygromyxa sp. WMMC2535]|uniref:aldehyde dehydrogenase family protein n=1 Tax=Pseudenhygromyxa sp. WMMC2535 TaxID=2712867 RepID=UPI0015528FAD|nr:aldehyde dehydrogenase family protein [Pseudenhygromyxa sp. WMMC2535]NVB36739.1 aldehyde dehydrogenase family protein [Pseudenhygromyxa sp. WMMC2535]
MTVQPRLLVEKTLKLYVGGKFIRSESGRVDRIRATGVQPRDIYVCRASRKDFRDAMDQARAALAGWSGRSAYNRGQILYRLAEILEDRAHALPIDDEHVHLAVDRVVHHAGWCDKIQALLSTLNPVATAHVNYSMLRPVGVVVAVPDPADELLGMVEALCAATLMGNVVKLFVPLAAGELATALAEALATCDMPAGVVDVMTTDVPGLLAWANHHDDLDAIYIAEGAVDPELRASTQREAARVMRRLIHVTGAAESASPLTLQQLAEIKTVWMSS